MKRLLLIVLLSACATLPGLAAEAAAEGSAVATKGTMLFSVDGSRLGTVYRVTGDGSAQMIIDGKMVTVPASTLATKDGKLTTSLKKSEVIALK